MKITSIIFDWSGVCTRTGQSNPMSHYIADKLNVPKDTAKTSFKKLEDPYVKGEISGDEFLSQIVSDIYPSNTVNIADFRGALTACPEISSDVLLLARRLAQRYRTILFSDNFHEMAAYITNQFSLKDVFHHLIWSNEAGMRKPDSRFYEYLIEQTQIDPSSSIFIDDREINLKPAQELGLKTMLYTAYPQLLKTCKSLGIISSLTTVD